MTGSHARPLRGARRESPSSASVVLLAVMAIVASSPAALSAQRIRGRVVDEQTRQPVPGAVATLFRADSAVVAREEVDRNGFFTIDIKAPGAYTITVQSVGYAQVRREIEAGSEDTDLPAFVLSSQVIAVDSVGVEVEGRGRLERGVMPKARPSHVVAGGKLARLERQAIRFPSAMRDLGAGLRVREWVDRNGTPHVCIGSSHREASFSGNGSSTCDWVALVMDGVVISDPEMTVRTLKLEMFESIEYLTPVEAGTLFGPRASATGALALWSRGRGPWVSDERNRH